MAQLADNHILNVTNLKKYFPIEKGFLKRSHDYVRAVDDVNLYIKQEEILGIVGESGCGKTTTARSIIRAYDPTAGEILFRSRKGVVNMAELKRSELKEIRPDMQMIFQDPYSSLNSRHTVQEIISEPLRAIGVKRSQCRDKVVELLNLVGLNDGHLMRYPHAFSGGQRQRIGIARALVLKPSLVIADEPVSALDVSVQAQIINLLKDLQKKMGLSIFFIAHDLSVIRYICDRVVVMYLGRVVEIADTDDLFARPRHPYTSVLLRSIPDADPHSSWDVSEVVGEVSKVPTKEQHACLFASRCPYAQDICRTHIPEQVDHSGDSGAPHFVSCHLAEKIELKGI